MRGRRRRHRNENGNEDENEDDSQNINRELDEENEDENENENEQDVDMQELETRRIIAAGRRKRRRDESPDVDGDSFEDMMAMPEEDVKFCAKCSVRFALSVYTRQDESGGFLCAACSENKLPRADRNIKKQRKRMAAALLDRKNYSIPTLQDYCIARIAEYIDDVEALGYIGDTNRDRISRIVTRNRKLNDTTVKLFLTPETRVLDFGDCSELTSTSYDLIPALCPKIESLTLTMCGQISSANLEYFASNLPNLSSLHLDGPFLIRKDTWISFLAEVGPRLHHLTIKSTHRLDSEVVAFLSETCHNLESLTLSNLPGILGGEDGEASMHMLASLKNLTSLELSYLGDDHSLVIKPEPATTEQDGEEGDGQGEGEGGQGEGQGGAVEDKLMPAPPPGPPRPPHPLVVTDDALISILLSVGSQLETLVLDGCLGLTDTAILQGIRPCCSQLVKLSLHSLNQISDKAVETLFDYFADNKRPGLKYVNLDRCIGLEDNAINALLDHSAADLVHLNLNGLPLLTLTSIDHIDRCGNLESLDVGFVRCVNDAYVERLSHRLKNLTLIEVFGDSHVTNKCKIRPGCRVIGRQDI